MENLRVLEINDAGEIVKYLNLSSKGCDCCYYYMEDEYTNNPVIRKLENYEIKEHMHYSFQKCSWGWSWKSKNDDFMAVDEIAQSILDIINRDY